MRDIVKLTVLLTVVCLLNGLALGLVYEFTRGSIDTAAARTLNESLKVVVPQADRFSERKECPLQGGKAIAYYEAYAKNGEVKRKTKTSGGVRCTKPGFGKTENYR